MAVKVSLFRPLSARENLGAIKLAIEMKISLPNCPKQI
jgi:hypothetical protein